MTPPPKATCSDPRIDTSGLTDTSLYDPGLFPKILRAQMDLMVQAMACGLTKVGVVQASHHTSELIMSRFPPSDGNVRSEVRHAQPPGVALRPKPRQVQARVPRLLFAATLVGAAVCVSARSAQAAAKRTAMLDYSLVVLCSEICDGNTHSHDNLPFIVGGRGGGRSRRGDCFPMDTSAMAICWYPSRGR